MKREDVLKKLQAGELSVEEADRLLAQGEPPKRGLYCKVSQKGAVSVYGLQRMPVTLYVEQWERLLDYGDELRQFLRDHEDELKRKPRTPEAAAPSEPEPEGPPPDDAIGRGVHG